MSARKNYPIDKLNIPIQKFITNEKAGGIVLGISVIIALFFVVFNKISFKSFLF